MVRRRPEPDPLLDVEVDRVESGRDDFDSVGVPHAGAWSRQSFPDRDELVCRQHGLPISGHRWPPVEWCGSARRALMPR
jgi:hypothetical protein